MAVSDDPVDLLAEARFFVALLRMFWSDLVEALDFIEEYLVGNGFCLAASFMLTGLMMFLHLQIWTKPAEQIRILVIIHIPPVIGLLSFVALHLNEDCKTLFLVLDCVKDCIGGLGIALFMSLWLASMKFDATKSSQQDFVHNFTGRYVKNYFPLTLILPRIIIVNQDYPKFLKCCTLQFVPIRLVCSFLMIFLQLHDMNPIWLSWAIFFILNVSVTLAFFTVFVFFLAFMEEFPQRRLIARFFYYRLISSVCFFQGALFKVLVAMGVIKSNHIPDNLVAFEMMLFSIFQCFAFSPGLYGVSQSSPQMKSTKLAAIAQPKFDELKKK